MNITSVKLIYFSPTHTTRKVLEGIAHGIQTTTIEHLDLTSPDARMLKQAETHDELVLIGSPVYGGRLPIDTISRLMKLRGNDTPAVIVVVYGNREYEDALLELRDIAVEIGFNPFAAGVFIGEHSYSNDATPVAVGRPDVDDLRKAKIFGSKVYEIMMNMRVTNKMPLIQVPGHFPYKERGLLSDISPITLESLCSKCETCKSVCPTAAITAADTIITDKSLCIRCCACIKVCTTGARVMEDRRILQMAEWLSKNCHQRKEPEMYL